MGAWIPYERFYREEMPILKNETKVEKKWQELLEANKYQVVWRRNQWLVPRFEGLERRVRQRVSQEMECIRQANIQDAQQMDLLWTGGEAALQRFRDSIQPTLTILAGMAQPYIVSQPADQPAIPKPADVFFQAIRGEG